MTKAKDPICRSFRQDFPEFVARAKPLRAEVEALAAKLALVIAAYRIEAMRRDDYSHDAFDQHIAELKGQISHDLAARASREGEG